jgi:hypothetical protein
MMMININTSMLEMRNTMLRFALLLALLTLFVQAGFARDVIKGREVWFDTDEGRSA